MRMEHAVAGAVRIIRERYAEPLSLDDLACAVLVSKFHLLRVFRQLTGVTPGRFLSAVRIGEAKCLLQNSDLAVAVISSMVGYGSTSSFTSRFTASVGIPPTRYRQVSRGKAGFTGADALRPSPEGRADPAHCDVRGVALTADEPLSPVYIGSFAGPVLQGRPSSWTVARRPGPFVLRQVPRGTCYLHAVMLAVREHPMRTLLLTARAGPLRIDPDAGAEVDLSLRPRDWAQPPILSVAPGLKILSGPVPQDLRVELKQLSSAFK